MIRQPLLAHFSELRKPGVLFWRLSARNATSNLHGDIAAGDTAPYEY